MGAARLMAAPAPSRARLVIPLAFWGGLGAALLALWWSGQAGRAWDALAGARAAPLAAVVALGMALPLLHALRWRVVMRALETDVPLGQAAEITVSASLVNYAGPGYLGAPAKAYLANRAVAAPYTRTAVSMAFEQGLDFLVLLAGSALALALVGPGVVADARRIEAPPGWVGPATLLGVAGVVALGVLGRARLRRVVGRVVAAFRLLGDRVERGPVVGLTLLYWLAQALVVALLLWALHLPLTFTSWLALATLPLLAGQVVPLPGGIGAREATIVALSGATGASVPGLLGLAVLQRVLLVAALPLALAAARLALADGGRR